MSPTRNKQPQRSLQTSITLYFLLVISSIMPPSGSTKGGTPLVITGLGFDAYGNNTKITVGGT